MNIPVKVFGDYVICFEAEPEDTDMRSHFIRKCRWTEEEFSAIENNPWFSAKVSLWQDAKEITAEYLGACCYERVEQFYTDYEGDYFADMVCTCAHETKDAMFIELIDKWHAGFRPD